MPKAPRTKEEKRRESRNRQKMNRKKRVARMFDEFPNCYYCSVLLTKENRSLDHYIPKSKGGTSDLKNMVTACRQCNQEKGNEMPHARAMRKSLRGQARAWKLFPCY